jgi:hypothetical protein
MGSRQQVRKTPAIQASTELEDLVRRRAYEIYQQRVGTTSGSDVDDWLQAEAELRAAARSDKAA